MDSFVTKAFSRRTMLYEVIYKILVFPVFLVPSAWFSMIERKAPFRHGCSYNALYSSDFPTFSAIGAPGGNGALY
jgi:hypothetical protein